MSELSFRAPVLAAAVLALFVTACSSDDDQKKLEGDRISVLSFERALRPDPQLASLRVRLPKPYRNKDWPQSGGYPDHAMHHLMLGKTLKKVWEKNVGDGSGSYDKLTGTPVIADGRIYVMDSTMHLAAYSVAKGKRLWRIDTTPEDEDRPSGIFGGGVAYNEGRLFVTNGMGYVHAVDAETGKIIWRYFLGRPIRSAPTVSDGRVFVTTYDNQLHALTADLGQGLWFHEGIAEIAGVLGGASPAVSGGLVIVPYSSGELYALRVENGRVAWSDALSRTGRLTALSSLNDIDGNPVVDRNRVFAISHGGRMAAIDLRTGERIWERNIASVQTPWLAGDFLFVVTLDSQVVCIHSDDGRIRWVQRLPQFEDEEDKEDPILWSGPVLAGDRLILTSSDGRAISVSPYTGEILGEQDIPGDTFLPPIIADGSLFIMTDDARLLVMR